MGNNNFKNQVKEIISSAKSSSQCGTSAPSSQANCSEAKKVVKGKVCVLGSFKGNIKEDAAVGNLEDAYWMDGMETERMLYEDNPDLSSCDKIVFNGHNAGDGLVEFPGSNKVMSAKEFADYLNIHGFEGSEINLAACAKGTDYDSDGDSIPDRNFAQDVSDITGKKVVAYPHDITIQHPYPWFRKGDDVIKEAIVDYNQYEMTDTADARPIPFEPRVNPKDNSWHDENMKKLEDISKQL